MSQIAINNVNLNMKHYNAVPVVTFEEIDMVHNRKPGSARRNFTNNAQHFEEGVDHYFIPLTEYRDKYDSNYLKKGGNPNFSKTLLTVTGYCLLAKTFNDDLSWSIQRALVTSYFNADNSKANMFDFLRQTIDVLETQSGRIQALEEQMALVNKPIEQVKTEQMTLFSSNPVALISPSALARQLGLYSEKSLPHQKLIKAIAYQAGLKTSTQQNYEDDFIVIERQRENDEAGVVIVTLRFKPLGVQRILDWIDLMKEVAYFEEFYQRNSKKGKVGELKKRGYRVGKREYAIA